MKLIVDAHALIWSVDEPGRLSPDARDGMADASNELLLSTVTIWEISIKTGIGKLTLSQPFRPWIEAAVRDLSAIVLPISIAAADVQVSLPRHHGGPFDRMLVAQAQVEAAVIVSNDADFDQYAVQRVW